MKCYEYGPCKLTVSHSKGMPIPNQLKKLVSDKHLSFLASASVTQKQTFYNIDASCGSLAYSAPEILLGDAYDAPAVGKNALTIISLCREY